MRHLKQEFDKLTFKDTLAYLMAIISLAAAIVLLFMGLMIDPEGEIHPSVLYATALRAALDGADSSLSTL